MTNLIDAFFSRLSRAIADALPKCEAVQGEVAWLEPYHGTTEIEMSDRLIMNIARTLRDVTMPRRENPIFISSKRREIDLSREDCDKAIHVVDEEIASTIRMLAEGEYFPGSVELCRKLRTLEDARAVIDQAFDLAN